MDLIKQHWTKDDYKEFLGYLNSIQEESYAKFHSGLVTNGEKILGIRVPIMRNIAKEISKGDVSSFLEVVEHTYNEEKVIHGFVIGNMKETKISYELILDYVTEFVPFITNWSVCDSFCSSLKITIKHKQQMFSYLETYAKSTEEFEARFAFVMYLNYFLSEEYIDQVFMHCNQCKATGYYVKMAVAWLVSVAFVKQEKKTKEFILDNKLDDWTYNKAIQKIIESNRVSKEEKDKLRGQKRR